MNELEYFVKKIKELTNGLEELTIEKQRAIISEINEFLFNYYDGIGTTNKLGVDRLFVSDFHKYWKNNHKAILELNIDEGKCTEAAKILHEVYIRTGGKAFTEIYDTYGLKNEEVCRVRLLTANQDFRGSRSFKELATLYKENKTIFDEKYIVNNPSEFVSLIETIKLSQGDKRVNFARKIAQFLLDYKSSPIDIIKCFNNNVYDFRNALISYEGAGYGKKKTDMFIRDMVVNKIWTSVSDYQKIDVASDINTMKVALRTGILNSKIPLISSLLDIFDYQYEYVDYMTSQAWRKVWEKWNEEFKDIQLSSPSLLDYFLYSVIGKQFCKEISYTCKCEKGHEYTWFQTRSRKCVKCEEGNIKSKIEVIAKKLPCESKDPKIAISNLEFIVKGICNPEYDSCPFQELCNKTNKKYISTPKSISILGQTGWETAYAKKGSGGGGLMA